DIFVFCSAMAPYAMNRTVRKIIDIVDADSEKWRAYAATSRWPLNAIYRREQRTLLALERAAALAFDKALFVTDAEAELFLSVAPDTAPRIAVVRNGVNTAYFNPELPSASPFDAAKPAIVFTGQMDYRPNIDAAQWFANDILP